MVFNRVEVVKETLIIFSTSTSAHSSGFPRCTKPTLAFRKDICFGALGLGTSVGVASSLQLFSEAAVARGIARNLAYRVHHGGIGDDLFPIDPGLRGVVWSPRDRSHQGAKTHFSVESVLST